ncbi:tryptophan 2,3-dioxygenase family protein [Amycolatopsis sp. OK19-0408]|uniref:Tryptophan 2,3-dioxygenase family protein n=1 Tax=Amycolatopsis iheyensis TaxID=2945988 RepID=A0A9X2SMP8_9PSEU|nr:tryptophan 2,3-dioxygenase family protein [Amycolatopsis iheyensis]MCR6487388.1 tryptophan 2,3-dioxygenase family protein [Amycolatopsis iheyensis]
MPGYGEYLRLPALLDLQGARARDELLFVVVHQAFELWFKQLLAELEEARDLMLRGESRAPRERLTRVVAVQRMLLGQFDVLDTLAPQDFARFRGALGTGNGGQSAQFREITLLSGAVDDGRFDRPWHTPAERTRLRRRYTEPTLWDGYLAVLSKAGFAVTTEEERFAAYARIAAARDELWDLSEALVAHDQAWAAWQGRHLLTVQRQIGRRRGTGGTTGAAHLSGRPQERFYPELWELRARL